MASDPLQAAFAALERSVQPTAEFADRLLAELERELLGQPAPLASPAQAPRRRPRLRVVLPTVAAAAAVVVLASLLVVGSKPQTALAAVEQARTHFARLPSVHLVYALRESTASDPAPADVSTTEVWFDSATRWRTSTVVSIRADERAGDFRVTDGTLEGVFTQQPPTFSVRRYSEIATPVTESGLGVLSPEVLWAEGGRHGVPPSQWFQDSCSAKAGRLLGRDVSVLTCDGGRLRVSIDEQTGLLLSTFDHDSWRTVSQLDVSPRFAAGLFEVKAPPGALTRWVGALPAPAQYAAPADAHVQATIPLQGLAGGVPSTPVATPAGLWVVTQSRAVPPYDLLLQRIDPRTNRVATTVRYKEHFTLLLYAEGVLWQSAAYSDDAGGGSSWVRPLDPVTGRPSGPRIPVEPKGAFMAAMAATPGVLWFSGGKRMPAGAENFDNALARIDLTTRHVDTVRLGGTSGQLASGFGSVWAEVVREGGAGHETLARLDPTDGHLLARLALPGDGPPTSVVAGDRYLYVSPPVGEHTRVLEAVDPTTNQVVRRIDRPNGGLTFGEGQLWMTDALRNRATRLDPVTLRPLRSVGVGRSPYQSVIAAGSLWVLNAQDSTVSRIGLGML